MCYEPHVNSVYQLLSQQCIDALVFQVSQVPRPEEAAPRKRRMRPTPRHSIEELTCQRTPLSPPSATQATLKQRRPRPSSR